MKYGPYYMTHLVWHIWYDSFDMTHLGDGNICWQPLSDVYDAVEYSGTQSRSNGGYECANWNDERVHEHAFKAGDHNYCRNPDGGADGPWCYTTDPDTKWDLCPVDQCQTSANEFTNAQLNCGQRPLFRNVFSSYSVWPWSIWPWGQVTPAIWPLI